MVIDWWNEKYQNYEDYKAEKENLAERVIRQMECKLVLQYFQCFFVI